MGERMQRWRAGILTTLSGTPDGRPPWVERLADGEDAGYFGPGSAAWQVTGGLATLVAGIRALLMQALHPGAMAGVHDHSRYREDPLGRLTGTIRWIVVVTYGSREAAQRESARVARFHERVKGSYAGPDGTAVPYSASDPELLRWVHLVFTDAFLGCERIWGRPIPGGPDGYVREWSIAGELVGVPSPPQTAAELAAQIDGFRMRGELRADERVADVVRFLRRPKLGTLGGGPVYRILFAGAVASLPPPYRRMLGLRRVPGAITATRVLLWAVGRILRGPSTSERAARERIARTAA